MSITLVGAGSLDFTVPLLRVLLPVAARHQRRIVLCDHDPEALDDLRRIAARLAELLDCRAELDTAAEMTAAVADAEFVVLTLNHGGLAADIADFETAVRHGYLPKHVDTIGPAGWLRAARMGVFCDRLLDAMPAGATLLDLSNPLSLLVLMAHRRGRRTVGFCHGAFNRRETFRSWLGLAATPDISVWGTNHLTWLTELRLDGEDLRPKLVEFLRTSPEHRGWRFNVELWDRWGLMPVLEAQHMADFFGGFNDPATLEAYGLHPWDGATRLAGNDRAARRRALASGETPVSDVRASREGVAEVIDALCGGPAHRGIHNAPLPAAANGLPAGAIAEGWLTVDTAGIHPDPAPALPAELGEQLARIARQQELAAEAAETASPAKLVEALALEPNVAAAGPAEALLRDAVRGHGDRFPPSWRQWAAAVPAAG